jgi:hypothetical protein
MNPLRLQLADAARVLSAASGQAISVAMLEQDMLLGAPTNQDGSLNLVHYAAWLVKEMGRGD